MLDDLSLALCRNILDYSRPWGGFTTGKKSYDCDSATNIDELDVVRNVIEILFICTNIGESLVVLQHRGLICPLRNDQMKVQSN